jgi:protein SCO1
MTKKLWLYSVFFLLLFASFVLVLRYLQPAFFEAKMPVLNYVQPFTFTNQWGDTITEKEVTGKVYVAEYFFTTCKGICPKMNTNMKKIYIQYAKEPGFAILSHTVDPDTDSVPRMKAYSDSLGLQSKNWWFLTGKKDSLYKAARVSYLLDDPKNNNEKIENQFIHTQFFALVDKSGRVRKIYDGLKKEELDQLATDISTLLQEKTMNGSFANNLFDNNPH